MGADGGSYAHRSELIKTKARIVNVDKSMNREAFKFCTLSKRLLTRPVVADPVGKLYNKDAVLEFFIDKTKYGDGEQICGYLKGVKDIITLNLTSNPTYTTDPSTSESSSTSMPFACPLSLKEMSGTVPFIAIRQCGCVFSEAAVRAVIPSLAKTPSIAPKLRETPDEAKPIPTSTTTETVKTEGGKGSVACPNCGKDIDPTRADAVLPINPPEEVQEMLLMDLLSARAAAKANKKRKAVAIESVEGGATGVDAEKSEKKKEAGRLAKRILAEGDAASRAATSGSRSNGAPPALASNGNANSNGDNEKSRMPTTVKQKLAEQEQKRLAAQANMSEAVRSMFKPSKDMSVKDETTEFFGRTFNRYA